MPGYGRKRPKHVVIRQGVQYMIQKINVAFKTVICMYEIVHFCFVVYIDKSYTGTNL
jgi:hypothetical protein